MGIVKNLLLALLLIFLGTLIVWGGVEVWGIVPKSEIRLFYIVRFGFIPIPNREPQREFGCSRC